MKPPARSNFAPPFGDDFFFFSKLRTSKIQARMGLKICPPGFTRNTDLKSRWENPNFPWKISGIWTKRKILGGGYLLGEAKRWPLGNERKRETNYEGGHSNSNNNNNNYYYYYYHHPDLFINWICPKKPPDYGSVFVECFHFEARHCQRCKRSSIDLIRRTGSQWVTWNWARGNWNVGMLEKSEQKIDELRETHLNIQKVY